MMGELREGKRRLDWGKRLSRKEVGRRKNFAMINCSE
jgi:hypothetical protein